jgi:hypothetical protein
MGLRRVLFIVSVGTDKTQSEHKERAFRLKADVRADIKLLARRADSRQHLAGTDVPWENQPVLALEWLYRLLVVRRYRSEIASPLRSAATINPAWRPDSVSTAPF